jgi:hypothetical protein
VLTASKATAYKMGEPHSLHLASSTTSLPLQEWNAWGRKGYNVIKAQEKKRWYQCSNRRTRVTAATTPALSQASHPGCEFTTV